MIALCHDLFEKSVVADFFLLNKILTPPAHLQHNDIAGWPDPLFMEVRKKFISTAVADFLYCTTIHYLFAILLYYVCQTCRNLRKQTLLLHLISWRENWIRVLAIGGTFLTVQWQKTHTNEPFFCWLQSHESLAFQLAIAADDHF